MKTRLLTVLLLSVGLTTANAQEAAKAREGRSYPPQMPGCRVETYHYSAPFVLNRIDNVEDVRVRCRAIRVV